MDAVVGGILTFDGECLNLDSGEVAYPVIWPHGAAWDTGSESVALDGRLIEPGRYVTGSGGFVALEGVEGAVGSDVAAAAELCAGETGEIAVFNAGARVDVTSD